MVSAVRIGIAVAAHPSIWRTALRQWRRTCPPGWWRRAPFLPMPDRRYLAFRLQTQYGTIDHAPGTADVLNYLSWCREWDQHR